MAMTAYMTVEGNNQGNIEGDCTQGGREKMHLVYDIQHQIEIPRDNLTGLPTGQRLHKPYVVTTHFSKGVPQLYQECHASYAFNPYSHAFRTVAKVTQSAYGIWSSPARRCRHQNASTMSRMAGSSSSRITTSPPPMDCNPK